ncbi:MAG: hypothetical protein PWQ29_233 [Verrucomicrobiota bacterium]|jgi:hypothetical protein|nr:hypothetical protein [Verrucomicrobiota bacterium]MDK2962839.1 hypothetical protein [Verrucomicrobiota bacterium]
MANLKDFIDSLSAIPVYTPAGWENRVVRGVFVSDLISDILVGSGEETLLLTSLLSEQVLRTADVVGAASVVLVNRNKIPANFAQVASKQELPLFRTPLSKFDACVRLGRLMESS